METTEGKVNMYYDPNKTLSRQRLFNFVVGARGIGKTYGCKKHVIRNFLRSKKQFVYLRRYETEMPAAEMRNFFDDVSVEFPEADFKSYNGLFRINGDVAGWYFPLSKATMLKSIPFPNVSVIIFDEFIIEVGIYRYLPNEVRTFLECYSTISRDRDVPVLFLSNAITMTNPYFLYFGLNFQDKQTLKLTEDISVELIQSEQYANHVKSTRFGRLISGTEYGDYHTENKFLLDTDTFIEKLPAGATYTCTFIFDGKQAGYFMGENGMAYLSQRIDPTCKRKYALQFNEHDQNTVLALRNNLYVRSLLTFYCDGLLRFDNQEIKNLTTPILRRLL